MKTIGKHLGLGLALLTQAITCASANAVFTQTEAVPALSEWSLVGLIAAVGAAAGAVIRRRGKK